jgi:hypothetical protein
MRQRANKGLKIEPLQFLIINGFAFSYLAIEMPLSDSVVFKNNLQFFDFTRIKLDALSINFALFVVNLFGK